MKKTILVTGSAGFIFSNFMRNVMSKNLLYNFVSIDKVIESYNRHNVEKNRDHKFYMGDIADETFVDNVFALEKPDFVIHGAAFSFVDASINSARDFIRSNVVGTQFMVDAAVKYNIEKFIYVSTDEVYGQLKPGDEAWTEKSPTFPRNPYSASKLAGELVVRAASETHGLKYNITRCANNYGKLQPPRNLIPKIITSLIDNKKIPIHGDGKNLREWLYVLDHCDAIMQILEHGEANEIYNIGSGLELTNLEVVDRISRIMKKTPMINFIEDRKGHDKRYSVNFNKIRKIGWSPIYNDFDKMLEDTIKWYVANIDLYK